MQEDTLTWDPVTINHPINVVARIYVFLLLFSLIVAIARVIRLAWGVGGFSIRRQVSARNVIDGLSESELATAALSNNFDKSVLDHSVGTSGILLGGDQLRVLERANVRFRYLSQLRMNDVRALKRSIYLLLLASGFVTFEAFVNILRGMTVAKTVGVAALSGGLAEISFLLTIAFGLMTAIYLVSIWFEGMLVSRENRWDYFVAQTRLQSAQTRSDIANAERPSFS